MLHINPFGLRPRPSWEILRGQVLAPRPGFPTGSSFVADQVFAGRSPVSIPHCGVVAEASGTPRDLSPCESGRTFTNEGASARKDFNLPGAVAGLRFAFAVQDADGVRVIAGTGDTIRIEGSVSAGAGRIDSTTIGDAVQLLAINDTEWLAVAVTHAAGWTVT